MGGTRLTPGKDSSAAPDNNTSAAMAVGGGAGVGASSSGNTGVVSSLAGGTLNPSLTTLQSELDDEPELSYILLRALVLDAHKVLDLADRATAPETTPISGGGLQNAANSGPGSRPLRRVGDAASRSLAFGGTETTQARSLEEELSRLQDVAGPALTVSQAASAAAGGGGDGTSMIDSLAQTHRSDMSTATVATVIVVQKTLTPAPVHAPFVLSSPSKRSARPVRLPSLTPPRGPAASAGNAMVNNSGGGGAGNVTPMSMSLFHTPRRPSVAASTEFFGTPRSEEPTPTPSKNKPRMSFLQRLEHQEEATTLMGSQVAQRPVAAARVRELGKAARMQSIT